MKKIIISSVLLASALFSADGYEVFQKNCVECHVEMMSKSEVVRQFKTLKAPPMLEVSDRLRENIIIKDDDDDIHRYLFVLFVKDYIQNPNLQNSMCHSAALERFGTMPKLKNKLSDAEKQAVAEWMYDRYENVEFK